MVRVLDVQKNIIWNLCVNHRKNCVVKIANNVKKKLKYYRVLYNLGPWEWAVYCQFNLYELYFLCTSDRTPTYPDMRTVYSLLPANASAVISVLRKHASTRHDDEHVHTGCSHIAARSPNHRILLARPST